MLVLSLFPGIDLLGQGFEQESFCIVRGPDLIWGGDIRAFSPPTGVFAGIIGGPPCQDFSKKRFTPPTGKGLAMLREYARCVLLAQPDWFVMENVPGVPDLDIEGYTMQRLDLKASEFGLRQSRLRHIQYGSLSGKTLVIPREEIEADLEPCCLASEGEKPDRRTWSDFCELQGLSREFKLPGMTTKARYRAVGNGVPVPMAAAIARAIVEIDQRPGQVCVCGCGRPVLGRAKSAGAACRKRLQRAGEREKIFFKASDFVTHRPKL